MVFRHISRDLKERCTFLRNNGYLPDDVCDVMGISRRSLSRWSNHERAHGSVLSLPNPLQGRPPSLHADIAGEVHSMIAESPELYLDEIQDWLLIAHDVGISRTALDRHLRDAGLTYKHMRRAAAERDEVARERWRMNVQAHLVAGQIVTVDESSKDDRTIYRHYGRAPHGERAVLHASFNRGQRWSIIAALSVDGYLVTHAVHGSVDGGGFFDFIVDQVLPQMNPYPQDRSVLIMDNCRIHKMKALREVVEEYGCHLVFLPAYSPDMNPIEESFSCLKYYMRRHWRRMQDAEHAELAILEACAEAITSKKAQGWFRDSGYSI